MINNILKFLRFNIVSSVALLVLIAGCSAPKHSQVTSPSASPTPIPSVAKETASSPVNSEAPSPSPQTDPFQDASDKAIGAATISQSAQSKDDWDLIFGMWQEAINLMKGVPKSSPNYALAQKKVTEYQRNLAYAKQQVVKPASSTDLTVAQELSTSSTSAVAKLVAQEPSSPSMVVSPELNQVAQKVVDQFFAIDSRLDVGMNYREYGNQVAELKVALDKLGRQPGSANLPSYARLRSALTNYETALTTWGFCIKEYYCENNFLEASSKIGNLLLKTYKIPTVNKDPSFQEVNPAADDIINWKSKIYLNTAISKIWATARGHVEVAQNQL